LMMRWPLVVIYTFFFQAEDGIRDFHVTGVQTCALPIWRPALLLEAFEEMLPIRPDGSREPLFFLHGGVGLSWPYLGLAEHLSEEIGRASCRERGLIL